MAQVPATALLVRAPHDEPHYSVGIRAQGRNNVSAFSGYPLVKGTQLRGKTSMDNLDPRATSLVSGIVAVLVPVANQTFGLHLTTGTVLTIVGALIGLGAFEVGHAHAKASKPPSLLPDIQTVVQVLPDLITEIRRRYHPLPVDPGIKAGGDMARGVVVKDQPTGGVAPSTPKTAEVRAEGQ